MNFTSDTTAQHFTMSSTNRWTDGTDQYFTMSTNSVTDYLGNATSSTRLKTVLESNLDQMYMILMGLLIQLMQCGFAFLEAGVVGSKNTTNIVMKNTLDACVAGVAYWVLGFAFAFGPGNSFIGWTYFGLYEHPDDELAHVFLELVIAATCSTLVSGSVVGRCKMVAYIIYSFALTGFIYPVVTRWVWNADGWLNRGLEYEIDGKTERIGLWDFSGSGAVHLCGGTAAFVAAVILGPRIGRFRSGSELPEEMAGHSTPYSGFGSMILLIGFMAFNGGSVMSVSNQGDGAAMSLSIVNTMIAAGTAGYSSLFVRKFAFKDGKWSVFNTCNGAVSGMVAICASCNIVRPWAALVIGVIAGANYNVVAWLVTKAKIDDPADTIGIHFAGGIWGLLAYAFLRYETGILYAWDRRSGLYLAWQIAGIFSIILWTGGLCILLFSVMKLTGLYRVSPEVEKSGSDWPEHGENAYQLHLDCFVPELREKLVYLLENVQLPAKTGYITDGEKHGTDKEKHGTNGEKHGSSSTLSEIKIMNNQLPISLSVLQPNPIVRHGQEQVNTGYVQDGVERTPL